MSATSPEWSDDNFELIDGEYWAICPECDHEQPDMGQGVTCEECGEGPMPTRASAAESGGAR